MYFWSRFRNALAPLVVVVLLIGVVAAAPARAGEMNADEQSAQGRIQAWSAGLVMFRSHPVTGVGYGRFTEFHERVAHNSFVHTFAELGIIGAFCIVGMWASFFRGLRHVPTGTLRRDLVASAVGTLVCAMFLSRQYVVVPYVLLALGSAYVSTAAPAPDGGPAVDRVSAVRIFVLSLAGIVLTRVLVLLLAHS